MTGNVQREIEEPNLTSRPLLNFTLPSCLKWGHQKPFRCMKLGNSSRYHPEDNDGSNQVQRISLINTPVAHDDDIEAIHQKLMTDLRAAAEHTGESERPDVVNNDDKKPSEEGDSNSAAACPWTLRSRRAGDGTRKVVNLAQLQKSKFSIVLSREEIEADFTAITGAKPPRKPKKRPRAIQKEIDVIKSLHKKDSNDFHYLSPQFQ